MISYFGSKETVNEYRKVYKKDRQKLDLDLRQNNKLLKNLNLEQWDDEESPTTVKLNRLSNETP